MSGHETICTNPCAEIHSPLTILADSSLSNLKNFVDNPFQENATFDYSKFTEVVSSAMRLSVTTLLIWNSEKLAKIIEVSDTEDEKNFGTRSSGGAAHGGRRTGLGIMVWLTLLPVWALRMTLMSQSRLFLTFIVACVM